MNSGLIASFDVGTTATKGVLVDPQRGIVAEGTASYPTDAANGHVEQDPAEWWKALCRIAQGFWQAGWDPSTVQAIALSGQMQDVVVIDAAGLALRPAILYSDTRAAAQATAAAETLQASGISAFESSVVDAASPLAKLLWLRDNEAETMASCARVLFSAKDYLLARLTPARATDHTTAGTTACYNLQARFWRLDWLSRLGVPSRWLPDLAQASDLIATVSRDAAAQAGFVAGTAVSAGMGDAAAATLAAGVTGLGTYLYLGTTAWAATVVSSAGLSDKGQFYLPYLSASAGKGQVIAAAPLLNAGSAQQWSMTILGLTTDASNGEPTYDYTALEDLLVATPSRSEGVTFLPYLNGERCPVQETRAMGTFLGMSQSTGPAQLAWAVLEGIAFSLRQVVETLGTRPALLRLVGGMASNTVFCQLIADICGVPVSAPNLPASGSALAAAVPVAVSLGWFDSLDAALAAWLGDVAGASPSYQPDQLQVAIYQQKYAIFGKVYPLVAQLSDLHDRIG